MKLFWGKEGSYEYDGRAYCDGCDCLWLECACLRGWPRLVAWIKERLQRRQRDTVQ